MSGPIWSISQLPSILTQYQSCDIGGPPPFALHLTLAGQLQLVPRALIGYREEFFLSVGPGRLGKLSCLHMEAGNDAITHRGAELRGREELSFDGVF